MEHGVRSLRSESIVFDGDWTRGSGTEYEALRSEVKDALLSLKDAAGNAAVGSVRTWEEAGEVPQEEEEEAHPRALARRQTLPHRQQPVPLRPERPHARPLQHGSLRPPCVPRVISSVMRGRLRDCMSFDHARDPPGTLMYPSTICMVASVSSLRAFGRFALFS